MTGVNIRQLGHQAEGWVLETREEAARELQSMQHAVGATLNALASNLASKSRGDDVPPIDEIQEVANDFLGTVRRLTTRLSDRLSEGMHERLRPMIDLTGLGVADVGRLIHTEVSRWEASIRTHEATLTAYVAGWIEGGGLALALMVSLDPAQVGNTDAYKEILQARMGFIVDRAQAAVEAWLDEVDRGLQALAPHVEVLLVRAEAQSLSPTEAAATRLGRLLDKAATLKVRIRNIPEEPSERYLEKLEQQLEQVERKQAQKDAASEGRKQRLEELMRFATTLNVRPKEVPSDPSDAWLDRMEAKLAEVAGRRNVPLPSSIEPPTAIEDYKTLMPPPDRDLMPAPPQRSVRVQSLVDRAHSVGLELGRIPDAPSDAWVADMEARLQTALQERRNRRLAMRQRRKTEQELRVERIQAQSAELGIQLGPVPTPLTEEWLTGAELAMASALIDAEAKRGGGAGRERGIRANALLHAASAAGVDLGIVPPQPDTVWLTWAESRVKDARAHDDQVAVETEGPNVPRAYLVYEEGTVQEQQWAVGRDAVTIGRSRGNDVQIQNDPAVSRRHASLRMKQGQYMIADLGSTKGTVVDNQMITSEHPLYDGARIQVGDTDFVFRLRAV